MPPLSQEFRHHLHELMVETSDGLRDDLNGYKQNLVWEAQKRGNSAGVPKAYSDAAVYAFRTRVEATVKSYLNALETCGIVVDAVVEREMLQEIGQLTSGPKSLTMPPGVTGPTVGAVQAEHARKMERTGNALQREAANRLREIKMRTSRIAAAGAPIPTMPQTTPFTIATIVKTLPDLKALPMEEQAKLLLRRLVYLSPQLGGDTFSKYNLSLPADSYGVALGFSDTERTPALKHLLGGPWTWLVNQGYLSDPAGNGWFFITEEGFAAAEDAANPKPQIAPKTKNAADGAPTVFISYSWESDQHKEWVIQLATRLRAQGINVILDRWDLMPGGDRTHFMETGVMDSDFVLIVCTPEYARKAKKRSGGVGYEAMVITGQLATQILQTKFIPVLRDGDWDDSAVPVWLQTKIGIDLRGDPYSDTNYQELLMTLHGEKIEAPPVGPRPVFSHGGYAAPHAAQSLINNAVTAAMDAGRSGSASRLPVEQKPGISPVAYAIYESKGPDADRVEAYIRPTDSTRSNLRMETSKGDVTEGTLSEIADHYLLFDRRLRQKGYSRMTTFDGSGGRDFNLP